MKVDFYRHSLSSADAAGIGDVLDTPFLTSGPVGKKVERQLEKFFNVPHALLSNSWTNGALAVLLAMDIGPGDEVIVPAMTFIASANVVELLGARPVFVDVDPKTLLMRPDDIIPALSENTRAVMPVHIYGQMCDMAAIRAALKERKDISIIEDCAHCFEGELDGEKPGTHSDAAIFSFYATKNIACGEGGAIITRDSELHAKIMQTRLHGMSAGAADRFKTGAYNHWDMLRLGVKANLPDLLAALLPEQIERVYQRLEQRAGLAKRYRQAFAGTDIRCPEQVEGALDAYHLFPVGVPLTRRDEVLTGLSKAGIGATVNYRAVHTMTYYAKKYGFAPQDFPAAYEWGQSTISLPLFPSLRREEQDAVIIALRDIMAP